MAIASRREGRSDQHGQSRWFKYVSRIEAMNWADISASMEHDPGITYLNTGTSGLIPKAVH